MSYSISLPFTQIRLRPSVKLTVATLVVMATTIALGQWQLRRADEKTRIAEQLAERSALPPVALDVAHADVDALAYRTVTVRGRYQPQYQFYLENRMNGERRGVEVVTPLRLEPSGAYVMVKRGWLADASAATAPPAGLVTVTAQVRAPALPGLRLGPANSDPQPWGKPWLYTDLDLFAKHTGSRALPLVLLLAPQAEGGFERNWPLPPTNVSMHIGYAIQWFAFAAIALGVWVGLSRERQVGDDTGGTR